ncbi:zinc finger protein 574 [Pelobates fuscus]|uniref:zinc finger protein 574 n=1 Tax=Pelobates fuscus TaxID=191477 RepID=UPI002FE4A007
MTESEETVLYIEHHYVCSECGEEYPNLEDAVVHQQTHTTDVQESQYQVLGLDSHENQYQCLECGQVLITPGELLMHQEMHLKMMKQVPPASPKAQHTSRSAIHYECPVCKALFNSQDVWMAHRYTHMQAQDVPQSKVLLKTDDHVMEETIQLVCSPSVPGEVHLVAGQQHIEVPTQPSAAVSHTQVLVGLEHSYKKNEGAGEDCAVEVLLYKCSQCTQLFQTPEEFLEHQATHFAAEECAPDSGHETFEPPEPSPIEQVDQIPKENPPTENCEQESNVVSVAAEEQQVDTDGTNSALSCESCVQTFQSAEELQLHQLSHQTGPFSCPLCSKIFPTQVEVGEHLRSHQSESHYLCMDCGIGFSSEAILLNHRRTHLSNPLYSCECGETFLNMTKFLYHRRLHNNKQKDPALVQEPKTSTQTLPTPAGGFMCAPCGKAFPLLHQLLRHQRFVHSLERRHKCPSCGKPFKKRSHLRSHILTHTGERPFSCMDCNKSFNSQANLLRHKLTHTGEKPHKCQLCNKAFSQSSTLQQHLSVHSQEHPYKCNECGVNFHRPYRLYMHQYQHTGEYPYKCQDCGLSFLLKRLLEVHQLGHRGQVPHRCAECGTNFPTLLRLQDHRCNKSASVEGEKVECPVCGKKVISDARLNAHVASQHAGPRTDNGYPQKDELQAPISLKKKKNGPKRLECPDCHKTFSTETSLQVHRRIHTGERPYPCPDCGKAFRQSTHLKDHLRLHTGEKPFKCEVCGKAFTIAVRLSEHKRIHTGERPHVCPECGRAYRSFSNLWKHRKLHREQPDPPTASESHSSDLASTVAILETVESIPIIETVEIFPEGSAISVQDIQFETLQVENIHLGNIQIGNL